MARIKDTRHADSLGWKEVAEFYGHKRAFRRSCALMACMVLFNEAWDEVFGEMKERIKRMGECDCLRRCGPSENVLEEYLASRGYLRVPQGEKEPLLTPMSAYHKYGNCIGDYQGRGPFYPPHHYVAIKGGYVFDKKDNRFLVGGKHRWLRAVFAHQSRIAKGG